MTCQTYVRRICKFPNYIPFSKEYLGKRVSLETLIVLDELVGFTKTWNRRMAEDYIWYDLKKLMKNYKRFLTIDKNQYRIQLLKLIEESHYEH